MQPHAAAIEAPGERRAAGAGLKTLLAGRRPPRDHDAPAPALDRQQGRAAAPLLQPPAQHSSADEAPRRVASRGGEPQCVIGWPPAADGAVSPLHDASVPVLARLSAAHV